MDRARALSSCVLATLLVTASTGCKGALGQVAAAGAVAAITDVQIAAMKSRSETSPQNVATYGPAPANGISPCGRTNMRIKGWMGRADQRTKVKGMFVDPEQIALIARRHSELGRLRLVVDWVDQQDVMTLKAELAGGSTELAKSVEDNVQSVCKVRGRVEFVAPGSLPNDGKVIDDVRKYT